MSRLRSATTFSSPVVGADGARPGRRAVDEHAVRRAPCRRGGALSVTPSLSRRTRAATYSPSAGALEELLQRRGRRRAAARGRRRRHRHDLADRGARERLVGAQERRQRERALADAVAGVRARARATAPRVTPAARRSRAPGSRARRPSRHQMFDIVASSTRLALAEEERVVGAARLGLGHRRPAPSRSSSPSRRPAGPALRRVAER